MNPTIKSITEEKGILSFTLQNINVSLANSLRRIILSEIITTVINPDSVEDDIPSCNISINTSRIHNEMLKQRLSCIPVHTFDPEFKNKYIFELDVQNKTDAIMFVTTEDFQIREISSGNLLSKDETKKIFPPCLKTNYYIDVTRLKPQISDKIPGEHIKLTCKFALGKAKENSCFNVVSKCSYGFTPDIEEITSTWETILTDLRKQNIEEKEIEFKRKNFMLLDAQRIYLKNSFDFVVKTVGVYENKDIVKIGAQTLYNKYVKFMEDLETDIVPIISSETTIDFCYDVILIEEDYTIGEVLEYFLYNKFYIGEKKLSFCGFKKMHPHDMKSTLRLALNEMGDKTVIKQLLKTAITDAQYVYKEIFTIFSN
jgi:DNA-directed RNA polymerase alpha subunit